MYLTRISRSTKLLSLLALKHVKCLKEQKKPFTIKFDIQFIYLPIYCVLIRFHVFLKLTNSTSWAIASREGLKTLCLKELSQNNTLQNETESDGISIVDSILSVACPGECNQRGTCNNGKIGTNFELF